MLFENHFFSFTGNRAAFYSNGNKKTRLGNYFPFSFTPSFSVLPMWSRTRSLHSQETGNHDIREHSGGDCGPSQRVTQNFSWRRIQRASNTALDPFQYGVVMGIPRTEMNMNSPKVRLISCRSSGSGNNRSVAFASRAVPSALCIG